ncbi:MAG TPA: beta-ketoacyl-[acyl-carrier-protein] synthase family protein [Tahibacter sp.]|nr:beta-ketoacyl-[acyl-carrier-protein] synthase family protein [Tahibacter sp.]
MSALPRVVITGAGAVSAAGLGAPALWQAMRDARGLIASHTVSFDPTPAKPRLAASLAGFDPAAHFDERRLILLDRVSQFALVAAREAVAQAGIDFTRDDVGERTAVIVGTGIGGELSRDEQCQKLYHDGSPRIHPMSIVRLMPNAPASQIGMEFGAMGPTFAVSSACASANHALSQALGLLRSGQAEVALAGGSEACLSYATFKAWEAMRVLADDTCRPFSRQRRGLVLGEGAGMFVLETLAHAQARGATILAEFAGAGMSADAGDIVAPSATGAARAMTRALADARLDPADIDYINAHGTGTPANDPTECAAIRMAFGVDAQALAVSSTKGVHGHALGAAGALELVAVLGALREGVVPPTANYVEADPQCDLDIVPNVARERRVRAALSNSFAFGGLNAVLALRAA